MKGKTPGGDFRTPEGKRSSRAWFLMTLLVESGVHVPSPERFNEWCSVVEDFLKMEEERSERVTDGT